MNDLIFGQKKEDPYIVGHRGARALYPENTVISFEKAIEMGVDGIETDLNMTKDGELVVIHDGTVDRTTNGSGKVSEMTLSEIRSLDAGVKFSPEYEGAKIPVFGEFLDLVKGKNLLLNIEIKDMRTKVVDRAVRMLFEYGLEGSFVIASFDANMTTYANKVYGVKTQGFPYWYLLNYKRDGVGFRKKIPETYSRYYSVGIGMNNLSKGLCDDFYDMGIDPWCWCPDDEKSVRFAIECGSPLMTCNDPRPALAVREEMRRSREKKGAEDIKE